jgi:outer membrane protein
MRFYQQFRLFAIRSAVVIGIGVMFVCGPALSAFGQPPQTTPPAGQEPAQAQTMPKVAPPRPVSPVENGSPLSIEDAVKMALENNLGIKAQRMNPEMAEYALEQVQASYAPSLLSSFSRTNSAAPPTDFLSAGVSVVSNANLLTQAGVQQALKFGGASYQVLWNGSRGTTDAPHAVFSPQLGSGVTASFNQPLLQGFRIDTTRSQLIQAKNNASIADLQLRQQITATSYGVRSAYYSLVGAIQGYLVAQESLDIAKRSLTDNQRRLQVGTIPQIDIVSSESEVANNEEAVIVEQSLIDSAEDTLRALVMNPSQSGFWTTTFKPIDPEQLTPTSIDVDAAVKNALENRTDLLIFSKQMDNTNVAMRLASNQKLPQANVQARYGITGIGGTQFSYDPTGLSSTPIGQTVRSFSDVLRDVLGNDFRTWSVVVNFSYPLGTSPADAQYAQAKIQSEQEKTSLENLKTQVVVSVREAARQVNTNLKRVEVDRKARELAQQKLDAEQKRFDVGLSSTLELFQAERDLDSALRTEVTATIDYSRSLAAFQAIQMAPLNGGS